MPNRPPKPAVAARTHWSRADRLMVRQPPEALTRRQRRRLRRILNAL